MVAVVLEVMSRVVVVSILTVMSTTLVIPAKRRRGSLRNGVRSCFFSGDSAAFEGEMASLVPRISSFMRFERFRRFLPVGFVDVVYVEQAGS